MVIFSRVLMFWVDFGIRLFLKCNKFPSILLLVKKGYKGYKAGQLQ